jgi:hypothetical protein
MITAVFLFTMCDPKRSLRMLDNNHWTSMTVSHIKMLFVILVFLSATQLAAQKKNEKKSEKKELIRYAERSEEVDQEIMGAPDLFFSSNIVSSELSNSSVVILAKKIEVYSDFKKKIKKSEYYKSLESNTTRYFLTIREKLKIQDKSALSEYSELSFSKIRKQSNFFKRKAYSFVGIRLIKPDGTIVKINVDEEAVNTGDDEAKDKYKLAIPGLEVGDIIDMYARVEQEIPSISPIDPLDIILGGEHPIVKFSFNAKVQREFGIIYTVANGTPEIKKTEDDDYVYLNIEAVNMKSVLDLPWIYERREMPVVKLAFLPGADSYSDESLTLKQGQILKELPKSWIDNFLVSRLIRLQWKNPSERMNEFKAYLKIASNGKENRLSEDSLLFHIYYFGRYSYVYDTISTDAVHAGVSRNMQTATYKYLSFVLEALHDYAIPYDLLYTVPRIDGTIYSVLSMDEFEPVIRASTDRGQYFLTMPNMFSLMNVLPPALEGQDAYIYKNVMYIDKSYRSTIEKLPMSKPDLNYVLEDVEVSIDAASPQKLNFKRVCTEKGSLSREDQVMLTLFEDYVDKERNKFGASNFLEELQAHAGQKGSDLLDEYKKAFVEARKDRLENARAEIENTFNTKPITLDSFEVVKMGNQHHQRDFVFVERFSIDGILKKAGANYILDMKALVTDQIQIKPEQRTREYNIYMPYARTYDYKVCLTIPAGFTVQGVENLQKNISNETGSFVSNAAIENGKLVIKATKIYNHNYEVAADWSKMLEFLDAAYSFSQEKILLKKI